MFQNDQFEILNKDYVIAAFVIEKDLLGNARADLTEDINLPFWISDITKWLKDRKAPKHRENISALLREIGCDDIDGFVRVTHALSLNDTFWVRESGSRICWKDVSLYRNEFDETIAHIAFEGGMYGKRFSSTSPEYATDGSYAKCWKREGNGIFLYKRGSHGFSNAGLEPYSEMYASQIAKIICSSYVPYDVCRFRGETASRCPLFTSESFGFLPMYKLGEKTADEVLSFFAELGDEDAFRRMVVLDALILNGDRHTGNYGILFDTDSYRLISMAPVFDNNLSLLPYAEIDDLSSKNRWSYIRTIQPKIGRDFNEAAHAMLTPQIRSDLKNMYGFCFDRNTKYGLSEERLVCLEEIVNEQIKNIIHDVRIHISAKDYAEMMHKNLPDTVKNAINELVDAMQDPKNDDNMKPYYDRLKKEVVRSYKKKLITKEQGEFLIREYTGEAFVFDRKPERNVDQEQER